MKMEVSVGRPATGTGTLVNFPLRLSTTNNPKNRSKWIKLSDDPQNAADYLDRDYNFILVIGKTQIWEIFKNDGYKLNFNCEREKISTDYSMITSRYQQHHVLRFCINAETTIKCRNPNVMTCLFLLQFMGITSVEKLKPVALPADIYPDTLCTHLHKLNAEGKVRKEGDILLVKTDPRLYVKFYNDDSDSIKYTVVNLGWRRVSVLRRPATKFTETECRAWTSRPLINPRSGKTIARNGIIWNELLRSCSYFNIDASSLRAPPKPTVPPRARYKLERTYYRRPVLLDNEVHDELIEQVAFGRYMTKAKYLDFFKTKPHLVTHLMGLLKDFKHTDEVSAEDIVTLVTLGGLESKLSMVINLYNLVAGVLEVYSGVFLARNGKCEVGTLLHPSIYDDYHSLFRKRHVTSRVFKKTLEASLVDEAAKRLLMDCAHIKIILGRTGTISSTFDYTRPVNELLELHRNIYTDPKEVLEQLEAVRNSTVQGSFLERNELEKESSKTFSRWRRILDVRVRFLTSGERMKYSGFTGTDKEVFFEIRGSSEVFKSVLLAGFNKLQSLVHLSEAIMSDIAFRPDNTEQSKKTLTHYPDSCRTALSKMINTICLEDVSLDVDENDIVNYIKSLSERPKRLTLAQLIMNSSIRKGKLDPEERIAEYVRSRRGTSTTITLSELLGVLPPIPNAAGVDDCKLVLVLFKALLRSRSFVETPAMKRIQFATKLIRANPNRENLYSTMEELDFQSWCKEIFFAGGLNTFCKEVLEFLDVLDPVFTFSSFRFALPYDLRYLTLRNILKDHLKTVDSRTIRDYHSVYRNEKLFKTFPRPFRRLLHVDSRFHILYQDDVLETYSLDFESTNTRVPGVEEICSSNGLYIHYSSGELCSQKSRLIDSVIDVVASNHLVLVKTLNEVYLLNTKTLEKETLENVYDYHSDSEYIYVETAAGRFSYKDSIESASFPIGLRKRQLPVLVGDVVFTVA